MLAAVTMQTHCDPCPESDTIVLEENKERDISFTCESFVKIYNLYIKRSRRTCGCTLENSNFEYPVNP